MKSTYRIQLGKEGESKAKFYLTNKGFKVLAENYRSPFGEVDLICEHGNEIVFVEVKTRHSLNYGDGREAVNSKKMERIMKSAYYYLKKQKQENRPFRFDVVSILSQNKEQIIHIPNAFPK